jgi:NADH dehydrogenase
MAKTDPGLLDDGVLRFAIIGGGATGVETAGALAELLATELERAYSGIASPPSPEVHLFEMKTDLLTPFKPVLRKHAERALERRGVRVKLGEPVAAVEGTRVHLRSGEVIKAHTTVWAAGLQANPVAASLSAQLAQGRPVTEPDLSLAGHPEVFLAGDIAMIKDRKTGEALPQLGSVAQQSGAQASENIARLVRGEPTQPFAYKDKGTMAMIGKGEAVVQLKSGRTLTGKPAWLAWKGIHLMLLRGGEQKARTLIEWTGGSVGKRSGPSERR